MPFSPPHSVHARNRDRAIILLAALIAVLPLLLRGASCGHDLDFHMGNWMEVSEQWWHGILWPRWAFTAAWGAGDPRFVFYPPLSWLMGGALATIFPIRFVPAIYTFFTLALCGLGMRRLAAEFTAPHFALLAGVFYLANPYMLFCAYERCAFGELLAAAWLPLLLLQVLRGPVSLRLTAIPVALLWLSNAPAAVMSCYLFALLALLRVLFIGRNAFTGRRLLAMAHYAARAAGGVLLGLGLAAFYIVPAVWERRWIRAEDVISPGLRVQDNTLFHSTGDARHDAVLWTASRLALLLLMIAAALLPIAWRRRQRSQQRLFALIGVSILAILFALTRFSLPLWQHLPQLRYIQFPWRLLALLGVLCSLLLALALRGRRRTLTLAAILLPLAIVPAAYLHFHLPCIYDDAPDAQVNYFLKGDGGDAFDEYTPRTADNDSLEDSVYPYWMSDDPRSVALRPAAVNGSIDFNTAPSYLIPAEHPRFLLLRTRNYPAWQVSVNGRPAQILPRSDGFFCIVLPPGAAEVTLRYRLQPDQIIGLLISLLSLVLFLMLRRRSRHFGLTALTIPLQDAANPFLPSALPT